MGCRFLQQVALLVSAWIEIDNAIGMPLIVEVIDKDNVTEPLVIVEPQPIVEEEKPKRTRKKKVVQEEG